MSVSHHKHEARKSNCWCKFLFERLKKFAEASYRCANRKEETRDVENGRKQQEEVEVKDYTQKKISCSASVQQGKAKGEKRIYFVDIFAIPQNSFLSIALVRVSEADDGIYRAE
jgi:hypothetical protein